MRLRSSSSRLLLIVACATCLPIAAACNTAELLPPGPVAATDILIDADAGDEDADAEAVATDASAKDAATPDRDAATDDDASDGS